MGQSTDAILLYGILIEEDAFESDEEAEENSPAWMAAMGDAVDGIFIEQHQSSECPRYFAAIEGTKTTAWRGHPRDVSDRNLARNPEWDKKLRAFVNKHKLPVDGEPGWWIASDWS